MSPTLCSWQFSSGRKIAAAFLFLFSGWVIRCNAQAPQNFPLPAPATKILVDSLANQLLKYYVEKDAAVKMSAFLRQRLKEGAYNKASDPHRLAGMLTADVLSVFRDEHFHVEYNPALSNEVSGNVDDVPKMVADKLKNERSKNFGFRRVEVLSGNIGYLELSGFSRLNQYSKETADAALRLLSNTSAIIIDLRYGVGGSPDMVTHILSHFFKARTHISDIYIRSENATLPYYTTPDSSYGALTEIPLYILTSYKTFSAAEGLAYTLQSQKRATLVGEVTRGGAHTVTYRPLSSGFVADIPFGKATDPVTKKNWERTGVVPEILTTADQALEIAESKIFEATFAKATDSTERRNLRWQKELLHSQNHPFHADTNALAALKGRYGPYEIYYRNGELFYQKTGKAKFPLIPVNATRLRPRANDTFMVEFSKDGNGAVKQLTTYYDDGRVETASKDH